MTQYYYFLFYFAKNTCFEYGRQSQKYEKADIILMWINYMPGLSIDNVIFGFHDNQLKVLLLECLNRRDWMLPGGYILKRNKP